MTFINQSSRIKYKNNNKFDVAIILGNFNSVTEEVIFLLLKHLHLEYWKPRDKKLFYYAYQILLPSG
jgi:hypothetical protein